jgi:hypothetical protein
MHNLFLTGIFILIAGILRGQSFEGTLTYAAEYKFNVSPDMEKMGVTKEKLIEKMIKEGTWSDSIKVTYKQDNYIIYTDFSPAAWSIYRGQTNRIYSFKENDTAGVCIVTDASIDLEQQMKGIKPVTANTGITVDINGWMCELVRVIWKSGSYDYYYQPSTFKIDPALYANHISEGWAGYLQISHALPIKIMKSINGVGTVTLTLSTFKEETVDDKIFEIPELIPDSGLNALKIANREVMRIKNKSVNIINH